MLKYQPSISWNSTVKHLLTISYKIEDGRMSEEFKYSQSS